MLGSGIPSVSHGQVSQDFERHFLEAGPVNLL